MPLRARNELLDHIYEAIVDDGLLQELPAAIAAATASDSAWIIGDVGVEENGPRAPTIICSHGIDATIVSEYQSHEHRRDPWMLAADRIIPGVAQSMARYVHEDEFRASDIHNEFIRGRADVAHCMVLAVPLKDHVIAYSMHRGGTRGYDDDDEAGLDVLRPHLVRLVRARRLRMMNGMTGPSPFDALLIGMDAVFICDANAMIIHSNVPAIDLVNNHSVLEKTASNRLETIGRPFSMLQSVKDAVARHVPTLHAVNRGGRRWIIRVDPATDGSRVAVIVVRDVAAHVRRQVEAAGARYQLTPAEKALAISLADGFTLEQHAMTRNLRMPTVRTQMSSLLAKSGCERQAQFLAALHEIPSGR